MNAQREHALASASSTATATSSSAARGARLRGESTRHAHATHASAADADEHSDRDDRSVFNVTLVTQTDSSRLQYLSECASRWRSPISAAVLLPPDSDLESVLDGRSFESHVHLLPMVSDASNASYPINVLRNLAIRSVRTTHFVVLDVDLWPSASLIEAITAAPPSLLRSKFAALVIPAFQLDLKPPPEQSEDAAAAGYFEASFERIPQNTAEMRECVSSHQCSTFYSRSSPETHSTTPYREWWDATPTTDPIFIPFFRNARYEPYVVLPNRESRTAQALTPTA